MVLLISSFKLGLALSVLGSGGKKLIDGNALSEF
jgi:hypothetical protein